MDLSIGNWRISIRRDPPTTSDLVKIYEATTWYWDSLLHRASHGRAYARLFERLQEEGWLDHAGHPLRVLDCGVGAGIFCEALIRTVRGPFEIYGIDLSPKMVARARSRLMRHGVMPRLECGDARSLPMRDGEMDLVMSALMLEHLPEPLEALREMTRVARSGAPLVLVVTRPHAPDLPFRLKYRYSPLQPNRLLQWMNEAGLLGIRAYALSGIARMFGHAYVGRKG